VADNTELHAQIAAFFSETMKLQVPSITTDLVQTRTLDSLGLMDLLLHLEQEYGIEVSLDNLEIDDLRSITKIAELVAQKRSAAA
jgi:methoxymalonate biosynthesis acyl carrier protein